MQPAEEVAAETAADGEEEQDDPANAAAEAEANPDNEAKEGASHEETAEG